MRTFRLFYSALMFWMSISSGAHAVSMTEVSKLMRGTLSETENALNMANRAQVRVGAVPENNRFGSVFMTYKNKTATVPSAAALDKNAQYKQLMDDGRKALKAGLKGTHVVERLAPETASFFVALGAIAAWKMIVNPSQNPVAFYQNAESQLHPITHVAFGAFMYANGIASPAFTLLLGNSSMKQYIPYLGMSAGLMASNLVHEVEAIMGGKLERCLMDLDKQMQNFDKTAKSCDEAFESWSAYGVNQLQQLVPSLMSLVFSTVLGTKIEQMIVRPAVIKMGLSILLMGTPTGWAWQAAGWTFRTVTNVLPFTAIDGVVADPFIDASENTFKSLEIHGTEAKLAAQIAAAKSSGWSEETSQSLAETMMKTANFFRAWKTHNMRKSAEAHMGWMTKVSEFAAQYSLTNFVYTQFLQKSVSQRVNDRILMDRTAPLYGVTPLIEDKNRTESLWDNSSAYMDFQLMQVAKVTAGYLEEVAGVQTADVQILQFKKTLTDILAQVEIAQNSRGVANLDAKFAAMEKIGTALLNINRQLGYKNDFPGLKPGSNVAENIRCDNRSCDLVQIMMAYRSELGNPHPLMNKGELFFAALEERREVRSNSLAIKTADTVGGIRSLRPAQAVLLRMFLGPDLNYPNQYIKPATYVVPLIPQGLGLAEMISPRLAKDAPAIRLGPSTKKGVPSATTTSAAVLSPLSQPGENMLNYATVLNAPFQADRVYENFYAYALENAPKLKSDQGQPLSDPKVFQAMWDAKVLPAFKSAWDGFEETYKDQTAHMLLEARDDSRNTMNTSSVSNGALKSMAQERKLFLMILGEVLRDQLAKEEKGAALAQNFSAPVSFNAVPEARWQYCTPRNGQNICRVYLKLIAALTPNNLLVFSNYDALKKDAPGKWTEQFPNQNLKVQDELVREFATLENMIDRLKVTPATRINRILDFTSGQYMDLPTKTVYVTSDVKNSDLDKALKTLTDNIDGLLEGSALKPSELFTEKTAETAPVPAGANADIAKIAALAKKLSPNQAKVYKLALQALRFNASELQKIGIIANEMSYVRSDGKPGQSGLEDPACRTVGESSGMARGRTKMKQTEHCIE